MIDFIKKFNKERKANKGKWIEVSGTINGKTVTVKSFDTWIQVAQVGDIRDGGPMDCKVSQCTAWLTKFIENNA